MMCNSFQINVLRASKTNYKQTYIETTAYKSSIKIMNLNNITKMSTVMMGQNEQSAKFHLKTAQFNISSAV